MPWAVGDDGACQRDWAGVGNSRRVGDPVTRLDRRATAGVDGPGPRPGRRVDDGRAGVGTGPARTGRCCGITDGRAKRRRVEQRLVGQHCCAAHRHERHGRSGVGEGQAEGISVAGYATCAVQPTGTAGTRPVSSRPAADRSGARSPRVASSRMSDRLSGTTAAMSCDARARESRLRHSSSGLYVPAGPPDPR